MYETDVTLSSFCKQFAVDPVFTKATVLLLALQTISVLSSFPKYFNLSFVSFVF